MSAEQQPGPPSSTMSTRAEAAPHTTAGKLADLRARYDDAAHAGSARAVERQHAKGKKTARERIANAEPFADVPDDVNAHGLARRALIEAGFTVTHENFKVPKAALLLNFVATDQLGRPWYFHVPGPFTSHRAGLQKMDAVWKALGTASATKGRLGDVRFVLLAPSLPKRPSEGDTVLRSAGLTAFFDAIALLDDEHRARLASYATGTVHRPTYGFWTNGDLARSPVL